MSNVLSNGIIYKLTNVINGKVYVGQTIQKLDRRWYYHVYYASKGSNTKIGRAIRKYGAESFSIEVVEHTSDLDSRERHYIENFDSVRKGYNIKIGGMGGPHAKSTKQKIAKANGERIWTDKMKANMAKAIKKWHLKRGFVPRSEEVKRRVSEANKGRKMSGRCRAIFEAHNSKMKRAVTCQETGQEFESISAACRAMSLNSGHFNQYLNGKCATIKGFTFKLKI